MHADVETTVPLVRPSTPAVLAGRLLLRQQLAVWRTFLPAVRAGTDPEALHQWRVCGRRLIAVLRVLESAQVAQARGWRQRIRGLLRDCGDARDLDIQIAALDALFSTATPTVHPAFHRRLQLRRIAAQARLQRSLDCTASRDLFVELERMAEGRAETPVSPTIAEASRTLVRRLHERARHAAREVRREPSLANCHALRLAIKKLRYVLELGAPLFGGPLKRYLRRLQGLQSLLGRINDARQLIPRFEVEAARARVGGSTQTLAVFESAAERQRISLQKARSELRARRGQLGGEPWRELRVRMSEVAKRARK